MKRDRGANSVEICGIEIQGLYTVKYSFAKEKKGALLEDFRGDSSQEGVLGACYGVFERREAIN
jgi:hypothetical protein